MARRRIAAIPAIVLCALTVVPAVAQVVYVTQSPGAPQGVPQMPPGPMPGVPQMPMPGGRGQASAAADLPPGTATLRGHVYAADNGEPLRKAQVRLMQQMDSQAGQMVMTMGPRESRLATTDAQGAYEFKELRAGR